MEPENLGLAERSSVRFPTKLLGLSGGVEAGYGVKQREVVGCVVWWIIWRFRCVLCVEAERGCGVCCEVQ